VRIYNRAVSSSVRQIYTSLFGLSVSHRRTMAELGPHGAMSATEIVERSSMDKVNVSRAIAGLREAGLLKRDIDGDDHRRSVLRLTDKGNDVFDALVPRVLALEEQLLHGLTLSERETLVQLMDKVRKNAIAAQQESDSRD